MSRQYVSFLVDLMGKADFIGCGIDITRIPTSQQARVLAIDKTKQEGAVRKLWVVAAYVTMPMVGCHGYKKPQSSRTAYIKGLKIVWTGS